MYTTRRLDLKHIAIKFHQNIPYRVMARTRRVNAGLTDSRTKPQHNICPFLFIYSFIYLYFLFLSNNYSQIFTNYLSLTSPLEILHLNIDLPISGLVLIRVYYISHIMGTVSVLCLAKERTFVNQSILLSYSFLSIEMS